MSVNVKTCTVHVRALGNEAIEDNLDGWNGHIFEEMLAGACWSADSRQILTFTDLQLRATVYSLIEQQPMAYIDSPKLLPPRGLDFSSNGKFLAIAERHSDCKTWISIYYAGHDWKLSNSFETADVYDLYDCKWIMNNTHIMVQDSPLES
jgi:hypothetical protein